MKKHYGIENIPADCTYLSANIATVLPELPSSLRTLFADSAINKPSKFN